MIRLLAGLLAIGIGAGRPSVEAVGASVGGDGFVRITEGPDDWQPTLSPDGTCLAYLTVTSFDGAKPFKDRNRLTLVDLRTGEKRALDEEVCNRGETQFVPPGLRWSADSRELICVVNCDPWGRGSFSVWRIDRETMRVSKSPVYSPRTYFQMRAEVASDGRSIVSHFADHRAFQLDDAHNSPIHVASPDGREFLSEIVFKDLFASPDCKRLVAYQGRLNELQEIGPDARSVRTICTIEAKDRYLHLLNFCGTTGWALITTGPRNIWRVENDQAPEHWQHALVDLSSGKTTPLDLVAPPGYVVALPDSSRVLSCYGAGPMTVHNATKPDEKVELPVNGPGWGRASPNPDEPWVLVKLQDGGARFIHYPMQTVMAFPDGLGEKLTFPVSWSGDGRQVAFIEGTGERKFERIIVLGEAWERDYATGAVWLAKPGALVDVPRNQAWSPQWSPAADEVACLSYVPETRQVMLVVQPALGGERQVLCEVDVAPPSGSERQFCNLWRIPLFAWAPDGRSLYVARLRGTRAELLGVDRHSGAAQTLWSDDIPDNHTPRQLLVAPDGTVVVSFRYSFFYKPEELPSLSCLPLVLYDPQRRTASRTSDPYRRISMNYAEGTLACTTPDAVWELNTRGKRIRRIADLGEWTDVQRVIFSSDGTPEVLVIRPNIQETDAEWHVVRPDGGLRRIARAPEGFDLLAPMSAGRFLWVDAELSYIGTGRFRNTDRKSTMLHVARITEDGFETTPVKGVPTDLYYIGIPIPSPDGRRAVVPVYVTNPDTQKTRLGFISGPQPSCINMQAPPRLMLVEDIGGELTARLLDAELSDKWLSATVSWSPDSRKVARIASEFKAPWDQVAFSRDNAYFLARGVVQVLDLDQVR
jgi:hypothetical protein